MNLRPRKQLVPAPRGADADAQAAKLGSAFAAPLRLAHDGRPGAFAPRAAPARCGPSCAVGCTLPRTHVGLCETADGEAPPNIKVLHSLAKAPLHLDGDAVRASARQLCYT